MAQGKQKPKFERNPPSEIIETQRTDGRTTDDR